MATHMYMSLLAAKTSETHNWGGFLECDIFFISFFFCTVDLCIARCTNNNSSWHLQLMIKIIYSLLKNASMLLRQSKIREHTSLRRLTPISPNICLIEMPYRKRQQLFLSNPGLWLRSKLQIQAKVGIHALMWVFIARMFVSAVKMQVYTLFELLSNELYCVSICFHKFMANSSAVPKFWNLLR